MSLGKELALGGLVHLGNGMIFIDCVYCQCLYPILRFLETILVFAAQKMFTEDTNSLKALKCATSVLRDSAGPLPTVACWASWELVLAWLKAGKGSRFSITH